MSKRGLVRCAQRLMPVARPPQGKEVNVNISTFEDKPAHAMCFTGF
ncbi:hypothetical protein J2X09_000084 [Hydrogenophaga laconesensis]|uniref:Uncharacterized protein n=1 Tax=Hydrogenophaga laconesensis TaxID=1805971 RepID=A0ABU1V4H7_9BURK|nr:hypothetical protein [Hydrogenophaga laconesensis]